MTLSPRIAALVRAIAVEDDAYHLWRMVQDRWTGPFGEVIVREARAAWDAERHTLETIAIELLADPDDPAIAVRIRDYTRGNELHGAVTLAGAIARAGGHTGKLPATLSTVPIVLQERALRVLGTPVHIQKKGR